MTKVTDVKGRNEIRVILFDLGGVLCRLHDPVVTFGLKQSHAEFMQRWLLSPAVREFERGAIDAASFARSIVVEANLQYDAAEFLSRFSAWPDQLFPGIIQILNSVSVNFELALLSNTNATHWERADIGARLEPCFDSLFLSYRTGMLKPDACAFENVVIAMKCAAGEILFFDDNPLNTRAAEDCGMQVVLVNSPQDLRSGLIAHNVLS